MKISGGVIPAGNSMIDEQLKVIVGRSLDEQRSPSATDGSPLSLDWLLDPMSRTDFLASFYGRRDFVIRRSDPRYYSSLFGDDQLDYALYNASKMNAVEGLAVEGRPEMHRGFVGAIESFRHAKSIRIDGVQRFSLDLGRLCRQLEQDFCCPININAYITPGATQALDRHYDTHDVLVIQTHGRKRWRLFRGTIDRPLEYIPPIRGERVTRAGRAGRLRKLLQVDPHSLEKREDFVLESGDCLYLPRGFWHEAEGFVDGVSCHLTIGLQAFLLMDLLFVGISQAATRMPALRQSLPAGFLANDDVAADLSNQLRQVLTELSDQVDAASALDSLRETFTSGRQSVADGLLDSIRPRPTVGLDSRLRRRPGCLCTVQALGDQLRFRFGNVSIELASAFRAACQFVATNSEFDVRDLPGQISDDERVSLAGKLVAERLLDVQNKSSLISDRAVPDDGADVANGDWLPVQVTGGASVLRISYLNFGGADLAEPFYAQSVARMTALGAARRSRDLSFSELPRLAENAQAPDGIILHLSRCGSTLLANGLKAYGASTVVSEAAVIGSLIQQSGRLPDELVASSLRVIGDAYVSRRKRGSDAVLFKCSSWQTLRIDLLKLAWPNVPIAVVVRDPVEIIVSCLAKPPGWMRGRHESQEDPMFLGPIAAAAKDPVEFCARALGQFCECLVAHLPAGSLIVKYEQLTHSTAGDVAAYFGMSEARVDSDRLEKEFATYSKDPLRARPFKPDSERKRAVATSEIISAAERWTTPSFLALTTERFTVV